MKNTFGNSVSITLFGESHGAQIGAVLDGLAPGIPVEVGRIAAMLSRRRPAGAISTGRVEPDHFQIVDRPVHFYFSPVFVRERDFPVLPDELSENHSIL